MKIATIVSSILLFVWVILTMLVIWTDSLNEALYIKLSMTIGIVVVATILIAIAIREYGQEKAMKDHNYLD